MSYNSNMKLSMTKSNYSKSKKGEGIISFEVDANI